MTSSPDTHLRKKIEIIVEAPMANAVLDWLAARGIKGWTVVPTLSGFGRQGHREAGDPGGVFGNVMILAVTDAATAGAVLAESGDWLKGIAGIVLLSDVEVRRPDHF